MAEAKDSCVKPAKGPMMTGESKTSPPSTIQKEEAKMKDREDKITMTFRIPRSTHRSLRMLAASEDVTIESIATRAIQTEIKRANIEDALGRTS